MTTMCMLFVLVRITVAIIRYSAKYFKLLFGTALMLSNTTPVTVHCKLLHCVKLSQQLHHMSQHFQ